MLDMRFSLLVQDALPSKDLRTAYLGAFWMKVNIFSFTMQFLLTPLLLRYIPTRGIQAAIPAVHILTCALLLAAPGLGVASAAFLLFQRHGLFYFPRQQGNSLYSLFL